MSDPGANGGAARPPDEEPGPAGHDGGPEADAPEATGYEAMPPPPVGRPISGPAPTENLRLASTGGVTLEAHLAEPDVDRGLIHPGVIFLHGFPGGDVWADRMGGDLPELADRTAQMGFWALSFRFRGCGTSTGHFSLQGWVDDVRAAVDQLVEHHHPRGIWLCGFGTGGTVGLVEAADDPRIAGVALAGSPADFADWAANPNRLMAHARRVGAIQSPEFPPDPEAWRAELRSVRPMAAAERFADRPLLVLHGSDDEDVPHFDARTLADAHGEAELRVIRGAGHLLRHDPRAVSILLGWLARQEGAVRHDL